MLALTLEKHPPDATPWSTHSMAQRCGLSPSAVSRIGRALALQPHRVETFQPSRDPLFMEKVRDIVGLYRHPPDKALAARADEKTPIQALDRSPPLLPMSPGQAERRTHDYVRHGTTSLVCGAGGKADSARRAKKRKTAENNLQIIICS